MRGWIVRPLAQADLDDAATWYEDQQSGLGSRFASLAPERHIGIDRRGAAGGQVAGEKRGAD